MKEVAYRIPLLLLYALYDRIDTAYWTVCGRWVARGLRSDSR